MNHAGVLRKSPDFACVSRKKCFNTPMSVTNDLIFSAEPDVQMERLRLIMHQLRAPGGCPWDREQTHESLVSNMLEEAYEMVDAIREQDAAHMKEELGDVLLQVVFHAEIAQESGSFDFNDVAREISDKLIRRHPHIFSDTVAHDTETVLSNWEKIKREERNSEEKPYLHGTGNGLPALLRAVKLQKKAGKVNFDWPDSEAVIEKIKEELEEVLDTKKKKEGAARLEEELGDLLFAVSNLCRKEGIDPELALNTANAKFERRFGKIEQRLAHTETPIGTATLEIMDDLWNQIKKEEKK